MGELNAEGLRLPRGTAKGACGPPSGEETVTRKVSRVWAVDLREGSEGHGRSAGILSQAWWRVVRGE